MKRLLKKNFGLDKNYIFKSSAKFINLTNRLKKVVSESLENIVYQLKISDFEVQGTELQFKEGYEYPPIKIELDNGKQIEITGAIDRIDIAKIGDEKYVRIIDYKSSERNIRLNEFVAGLQIQLITYLDAITKIEDFIPAGALYFNVREEILDENKEISEEKLKEKIRNKFRMKGIVLADVNILKKMDTTLTKSTQSAAIPVYLGREEDISIKKSSVASKKQFEYLQKQAGKVIKQIASEILAGDIGLTPSYSRGKSHCSYCAYKAICGFNRSIKGNEYKYIEKASNLEMLSKIEEINEQKE